MKLVRARVVLPICSPPVENGAVLVDGKKIHAVGKFQDLRKMPHTELIDTGEVILMPGLINAHCHLDYTMLRKALLSRSGFSKWIRRLNSLKARFSDEDYLAAIADGMDQLISTGTTTVINIASFPALLNRIPKKDLSVRWCMEMMDIRTAQDPEELLQAAVRQGVSAGLSPHSPYTASLGLYQRAAESARAHDVPFTTHLAESAEEEACFYNAEGGLHELITSIRPAPESFGKGSPLRMLLENNALPEGAILVHMNTPSPDDFELLKSHPVAQTFHVVHCPGSHDFFDHPPFPLENFLEAGIPVSLGTDSLASTDTLDLFTEIRRMRQARSNLPAEQILEMVTRNPAAALKVGDTLGCLKPDATADMIAADFSGSAADAPEYLVSAKSKVTWRMWRGTLPEHLGQSS